jgi:hypothetical protein
MRPLGVRQTLRSQALLGGMRRVSSALWHVADAAGAALRAAGVQHAPAAVDWMLEKT